MEIKSFSKEDTFDAGFEFAKILKPKDVVALFGEIGTGKTQFTKGVASYFTIKETVNSPTFILVNEYNGINHSNKEELTIYHFDLYRLKFSEELEVIGFNDYINKEDCLIIVEWPELALPYLNTSFHRIYFKHGENEKIRYIVY